MMREVIAKEWFRVDGLTLLQERVGLSKRGIESTEVSSAGPRRLEGLDRLLGRKRSQGKKEASGEGDEESLETGLCQVLAEADYKGLGGAPQFMEDVPPHPP